MLEEKIFETIRNAWELDQGHPGRDREKKPIPELHELRAIIETAFLASKYSGTPMILCTAGRP
jgi:hypothetical protein